MKKLWQKIKALVNKKFKLLKENEAKGRVAIAFVNALKDAVNSQTANFLVHLTKTKLDDKIFEKAKIILPAVLQKMALTQGIIEQSKSFDETAAAVIAYLQKKYPDGRKGFYADAAADILVALSDGKLSWHEALEICQDIYHELN